MKAKNQRDAFRGCLMAGAMGDALGYAVEFVKEENLFKRYGSKGIQAYCLERGEALVSDDTQMTLFTANGLIRYETDKVLWKTEGTPEGYLLDAYRDWYYLQEGYSPKQLPKKRSTWLCEVPEMSAWRAPGNTCLSALSVDCPRSIAQPINNSKGCGGVMRVAPVGLFCSNVKVANQLAAEAAALTHGHALGYLSAAMLAHIVNRCVYGGCEQGETLEDIVRESIDELRQLFGDCQDTDVMCELIERAIALSREDEEDLDQIHALGEGWVGEEALAVAVYCALKYQDDFSEALRVSVNHSGDSDSTGAIVGNILGAWIGYEAIPAEWKQDLECKDVIWTIVNDLYDCCHAQHEYEFEDPTWVRKYVECKK